MECETLEGDDQNYGKEELPYFAKERNDENNPVDELRFTNDFFLYFCLLNVVQ